MKRTCIITICFLSIFTTYGQSQKINNFPLSAVRILNGPFLEAQQTDMKYMLELDPDRLLAPYLREAGIEPKKPAYGNWENTGLDGHMGGHYLSALSNMYAATGDKEILDRLNYMLSWLEKCQLKSGDGYIGGVPGGKAMWKEIAAGKINAGSFSLNDKWVPLYNIHKPFAGLIDAYQLTGSQKAKEILIRYAAWAYQLTAGLTALQIQEMLRSEHGGMNEVFADVSAITGDSRYLELARKFSHHLILDPLLQKKDILTGMHANTQIPKVIGFMRVAELSNDKNWENAASFFWQTVVQNRTVSIGGNSVSEHFNPSDDFSSMMESREGPETCNSYNMLKLTRHLFLAHPLASYIDYYERTLYNHILSSQSPSGGFVYFTPMRPGHYKVYSKPQEGFWCCVGSGLENHGKYGELIYAHKEKDLFVNLFLASTLEWKEKKMQLVQQTTFPEQDHSSLSLKLAKAETFAIHFRYPGWLAKNQMTIKVNGKKQILNTDSASYVSVNRKWKSGDVIDIHLPMHTQAEFLPDGSDYVSFVHGPIVLAASMGTADLAGLKANGDRMAHIANGRLLSVEDAPLIIADRDNIAKGITAEKMPMTFKAANMIYQQEYKSLELIPFYKLNETRYMVYWPFTNPQKLPALLNTRKEKAAATFALDAITIDKVSTGEQQPESDHGFKGEHTWEGIFKDRHFRTGTGWFSYVLKDPKAEASGVRLTYFGKESNRNFDIYANDVLLDTIKLDGNRDEGFYDVVYPLPAGKKQKEIVVRLMARPGSSIPAIYEVRLLK